MNLNPFSEYDKRIKNLSDYLLAEINAREVENKSIFEKTDKLFSELGSLTEECRLITVRVKAIIDYFDLDFKEEWIDDPRFMPAEPRKVPFLKAIKKHGKK